ncbi:MAG: exodeoxyribonuclease VII large subunit [Anaerolineae bacterium]|nr:exodeoxyribonuclease VII large subunit [Anaerolineae bacterium]
MPIPFSVGEVSQYIREMFDSDEQLQDVWVSGEISNLTRASSGHWYFTLKDSNAQLRCAMWRSYTERQSFVPRNGDAVTAHGRVSVYEPRGEYQLYADALRPAGVGDLYAQFEQLKAQLQAEGLFDSARKRPIPDFPQRIGVVTSPEAAAFQDIQNVLRRRYPLAEIILSPTQVQGESAPPLIVAALDRLNNLTDVDVILLCRGGGSIEDLWAFNDERVARAVAASHVPVISGVGHETDFTIVDFVADQRAPTPSAAAEVATPNLDDLAYNLRTLHAALSSLMRDRIEGMQADLHSTQRTMGHLSPLRQITNLRQRIDDRNSRMLREEQQHIAHLRERLESRAAALDAASPQAILARGYAIATHNGQRLTSIRGVRAGDEVTVQLHDGQLTTRVEETR